MPTRTPAVIACALALLALAAAAAAPAHGRAAGVQRVTLIGDSVAERLAFEIDVVEQDPRPSPPIGRELTGKFNRPQRLSDDHGTVTIFFAPLAHVQPRQQQPGAPLQ